MLNQRMNYGQDWNAEDNDLYDQISSIIKTVIKENITDTKSKLDEIQSLYDKINTKHLINKHMLTSILVRISFEQIHFFISVIKIIEYNDYLPLLITINETIFYKLVEGMRYVPDIKDLDKLLALLTNIKSRSYVKGMGEEQWSMYNKIYNLILISTRSSIDCMKFFDSQVKLTHLIKKFAHSYYYHDGAIVIFNFISELLKDVFYHTTEQRIEMINYVKNFFTVKNVAKRTFESMGVVLNNNDRYQEIKNKIITLLSQYDMVFTTLQDRVVTVLEKKKITEG